MKSVLIFFIFILTFTAIANDREKIDEFIDNNLYAEALKLARGIYQKDKTEDKNLALLIRCINYRAREIFDSREDNLKAYQLINETLLLSEGRKLDSENIKHSLYDYNSIKHKRPRNPDEELLRSTFLSFYENLEWKQQVKKIKTLLKDKKTYKKGVGLLRREISDSIHWKCAEKNWHLILQDYMTLWKESFELDREKCIGVMIKEKDIDFDWEFLFPDAVYLKSPYTNSNEEYIKKNKEELTKFFTSWKNSKDPAIQLLGEVYCLHLKIFDDNENWQKEINQLEKRVFTELKTIKSKQIKRLYISVLVSLNFFRIHNAFTRKTVKTWIAPKIFKKTVLKIRAAGLIEDEAIRSYMFTMSPGLSSFSFTEEKTDLPLDQINLFLQKQRAIIKSPLKFKSLISEAELKELDKKIADCIKYINPPDLPQIKLEKVEKIYTHNNKSIIEMTIKNDQLYFLTRTHFYKYDLNKNKNKQLLRIHAYFFDINEGFSAFSNFEKVEIYTSKYKKVITLDKLRLVNGNIDGISLFKGRLFINTCSDSHSGRRILWDYDIEKDHLKRIADSADTGGKTLLDNVNGYSSENGATDKKNARVLFTANSKKISGLFEYSFKTGEIKQLKELHSFAGKVVPREDSGFLFAMEYKTFSLSKDQQTETLLATLDGGMDRRGSIYAKGSSASSSCNSRVLINNSFYYTTNLDGYAGDFLIRAYPGGIQFEILSKLQETEVDWYSAQLRTWKNHMIVVTEKNIWKLKPGPPSHPLTIKDETLQIISPNRSYSDKPTELSINFKEDYDEISWTYSNNGDTHTFVEKLKTGQRSLKVKVPIINDDYLQCFTINATALKSGRALAWGRSKLCNTHPQYDLKWFKEALGPRKFSFIDFSQENSLSSLVTKGAEVNIINRPDKLLTAKIMPVAISGRFLDKHPAESKAYLDKVIQQKLPIVIHGPCKANPYLPVSFKGNLPISGKFYSSKHKHIFSYWPFHGWEGTVPMTQQGSGPEAIQWKKLLQNDSLPMITESSLKESKVYSIFPDLAASFKTDIYSGYIIYELLNLLSDKEEEDE